MPVPPRALKIALAAAVAAATLILALTVGTASSAPKKPYTATPGPERPDARFVVRYEGSGAYKTRFHATPPNPDGKPDKNDAWDSSKQSWAIKFQKAVTIPTCGPPAAGFGEDPCKSLTGLTGAKGATSLSGHVNHRHIDGLYKVLDRKVKCDMRKRPSKRRVLDASIQLRYIPETQSIGVSASDPIATAVSLFPPQCPKQGDSIDRILDFYAMPGFSFAEGYGPERWFASKEVIIPAEVFHRSSKISIPLHDVAAGRPPRHCALHDPSFERCKTGGSWKGVLTFKAQGGSQASAARLAVARKTAPKTKVRVPKSGHFHGDPLGLPMDLYTQRRHIELAAFSFKCGDVTGRTSINDIKMKWTKKGYRFGLKTFGNVTYSDEQSDENGSISFWGRFTPAGNRVKGTYRIKTKRCGGTGTVEWRAKR